MTSTITTIDPTSGKKLESYPMMSDGERDQVIEDSHAAFLKWRDTAPEQRADIIRAIGEGLRSNKDALAKLMTQEMGKLLKQSQQEVGLVAGICDYTADQGPGNLKDEERELPNGQGRGIITYAPMGVIYGIQPWNYPSYQVVRYSIANLMAGNSVLLKHAECVTGTALMLEKIYREAGLPENLFRVLLISHDQSDAVIAHKSRARRDA